MDDPRTLLAPLELDPRRAARSAGLRYVSDARPGYTRKRRGRGFAYYDAQGQLVTDPQVKQRLEGLVIPPAWQEVWICPDPNGHLQATGRDEKGRKQYVYHPEWDAARNLTKFARMRAFAAALPGLRERIAADLRRQGYPREKVLAILVFLLERTLIRIGNAEYARKNDTYGLTTLKDEHFDLLRGDVLKFSFIGKSGKQQDVEVRDRRLAKRLRDLQELPGQSLFQYEDESGKLWSVGSNDVNEYLRECCGGDFSAKDFRTWGGTRQAAVELYQTGPAKTKAELKRNVSGAIKRVAGMLGNTVAVCRQYYVHPEVLAAYEDGTLFEAFQKALQTPPTDNPYDLEVDEIAIVNVLGQQAP